MADDITRRSRLERLFGPPVTPSAVGTAGVATPTDAAVQRWLIEDQLARKFLGGGEMIALAVKPSRWFVLFTSVRWLAVCVGLVLAAPMLELQFGVAPIRVIELAVAGVILRLGVGVSAWHSTLYMLSSRRTFSIHGILRQHVNTIDLRDVRAVHISRRWFERAVRVGTLVVVTEHYAQSWLHIRDAEQIRERILRAAGRCAQLPSI